MWGGLSRRATRNYGWVRCRQDNPAEHTDISFVAWSVRVRYDSYQRPDDISGCPYFDDGLCTTGRSIRRYTHCDGASDVSGHGANGSTDTSQPEDQTG